MRIRYRFDDKQARAATAELRRAIGKDARRAVKAVAEKALVPPARRRAPSLYSARVRAVGTARGAGVRVSVPRGSELNGIVGWLEFGGRIHAKRQPYLTFRVGGKWVRVRYVQRPFVKGGRYVGAAMRDPGVVVPATEQVRVELSRVLTDHLGPAGVKVTR